MPLPKRRVLLAIGFPSPERQAGIARYAREAGWMLDSRLQSFHAIGQDQEYLNSSRYDGVLALCSKASPWLPELINRFSVPVVDMWLDYPNEKYPRVLLDQPAIGRMGAEHLLSRGFRELLFYTHAIEGKVGQVRGDVFRQVAKAAGVNCHTLVWDHQNPVKPGRSCIAWLADWLSRATLPIGVMGSNDQIACEVLEATELAGLKVPRQVAILGVDNDPLVTELTSVPISSVDSAKDRVGYEAAALLDRMMQGEKPPREHLLIAPSRVVARRSTDVRAVRDPDVAAAIQFIQDHFHEPITVDTVAGESAVSRRHLQDQFRNDTGQTISEMITSQRLEHAKGLLIGTRLKLRTVAEQSGFGSGERMSKVFRRVLEITPVKFREDYARSGSADAKRR